MIVSFRKDEAEMRTGVNHLTGDLQEEVGSADVLGSGMNRNNPSSSLLQLAMFELFLLKPLCT